MREILKESDIYEPSQVEKRILEVALNPESFDKTIKERCTMADVSRDSWYRVMNNPKFIALLNTMTMDMLKGSVNDIINATVKYAKSNPRCSADRKVLLTMLNLYTDKLDANVNEDVTIKVTKPDFNSPKE
ncbi:hypothetical protein [Desulfitobacterium metallireducens]|uniref:Homeodomain phBC6A51-type domain-containing protein n=1 Tax=Desulfitobacterium metallireducens DSM 15288 TaxID=871968 RepID=W0ECS7_9FIRM|nr:hypothetical protein [Desulfitobacterium metallireducens]AHF08572.1 hypothetical protein DESME_08950 [Desulfitobacterium metallireducens DSM 15288]